LILTLYLIMRFKSLDHSFFRLSISLTYFLIYIILISFSSIYSIIILWKMVVRHILSLLIKPGITFSSLYSISPIILWSVSNNITIVITLVTPSWTRSTYSTWVIWKSWSLHSWVRELNLKIIINISFILTIWYIGYTLSSLHVIRWSYKYVIRLLHSNLDVIYLNLLVAVLECCWQCIRYTLLITKNSVRNSYFPRSCFNFL